MRIANSLIIAVAVLSPMTSFAVSTGDESFKDLVNEHQVIVQEYAEKSKSPMPSVIDYTYGMKLDIAKVVRTSPDMRNCKVIPQLMTYEDSTGKLNTIKYQIMSGCRGKN
jgi:hypothetical protein